MGFIGVTMESPFLSVKEAASLLGRSSKWVYLNKEEIPGFFRLAGSIFFDKTVMLGSIEALISKTALKEKRVDSRNDRHSLL